jgi:hypothetical protein
MPRRRVKVFQSSHKLFDPFFSFVNDKRIAVCCRRGRGQQRGDGFDFGCLDGLAGGSVFDALRRANNTVGVRNMQKMVQYNLRRGWALAVLLTCICL